jgi:hypothetical protein
VTILQYQTAICSLTNFRELEPPRPCFSNPSQTKPLLKSLVRTSPLSLLLRCRIINIERGRLYLSYSRVCCAECTCHITPVSHHTVLILSSFTDYDDTPVRSVFNGNSNPRMRRVMVDPVGYYRAFQGYNPHL